VSPLPNCIPGSPWWQLLQWIADPLSFQDRCSRHHGDVFTIQLSGFEPFVIIGDPQAIQDIFSQDAKFDVGPT
jgi:cytochrome P450 family 110